MVAADSAAPLVGVRHVRARPWAWEVVDAPDAGPGGFPSSVRTAAGQIRILCPAGCATRSEHSQYENELATQEIRRAVITALRKDVLPYKIQHAVLSEQRLHQHPAGHVTMTGHLTDDLVHRSYTCARWQLQIPLPVD
jgi:hypothetical protein